MDASGRVIPAPRKNLSKVSKRKHKVTSVTAAAVDSITPTVGSDIDLEKLLASIGEDTLMEAPRVNYYTYPTPPTPQPEQKTWEPQLLIRQIYKLTSDVRAVIGLECFGDYNPSIYLVNEQSSISIKFEDLISLRSISTVNAIDSYFQSGSARPAIYLETIVIESGPEGYLSLCNYQIQQQTCWNGGSVLMKKNLHEITRGSNRLLLHVNAWSSLKRCFDCIESYFNICFECSSTAQQLISRYSKYLTNHYRAGAIVARNMSDSSRILTVDPELVQYIKGDLPFFLQELNERRLPVDDEQHWPSSYLHTWLDSEIRRYCAPKLLDTVLENLKYYFV